MSPSRENPDCSMDMAFIEKTDRLEDRLYTYETLASLCKGGSGNKKQCRQACKKVLLHLLRDLQETFPIVGLELLGCFIQLFGLSSTELESVIDIVYSKLKNCSNKITCRKAMWCLANIPITAELPQEKVNLVTESSLLFVQEHHEVVSNSIVCEAFKALKRVSDFDREYLTPYLEQTFTSSVQYLFHDADRLRELSLAVLYQYAQDISRRGYVSKTLLEVLKTTYIIKLATFVEQRDPNLPKLWEFVIVCTGPCLQSNGNLALVNELLRVEELALKSSDLIVRLNAINAWEKLIDVFISCGRTPSGTRLKLLTGPLKSGVTKTQEIGAAKLRLWWYLITKLQDQAVSRFQLVTLPFLTFFFGSAETPSTGGPLTLFPGLALDATLALISVLAPDTTVESGPFSRQFLLISPDVFSTHCGQIRAFCERAVEYLDSDSELVFRLWHNFKKRCLDCTSADKVNLFQELQSLARFLLNLAENRGSRDLLLQLFGEVCDTFDSPNLMEFSGIVSEALSVEQKTEAQDLLLYCWEKMASGATPEHIDARFIAVPLQVARSENHGFINTWDRCFRIHPHGRDSLETVLKTLNMNPNTRVQEEFAKRISSHLLEQLTDDGNEAALEILHHFTDFLLKHFSSSQLLESWKSKLRTLSKSEAPWNPQLEPVLARTGDLLGSTSVDRDLLNETSTVENNVRGVNVNKRRLSDDSDSDVSVVVEAKAAKRAEDYLKEDWKLGCAVVLVEAVALPDLTDVVDRDRQGGETTLLDQSDSAKLYDDYSAAGFAAKGEDELSSHNNTEETPLDDSLRNGRQPTMESETRTGGTSTSANYSPRNAACDVQREENRASETTSSPLSTFRERKTYKAKSHPEKPGLPSKNRGAQMIEAARRTRNKQPASPSLSSAASAVHGSPSSSESRPKHTYSPLASPSGGILKRPGSAENSPSCSASKNRRVSFRCPVISDQIEFSTETDEERRPLGLSRRSLLQSYNQVNNKQPALNPTKLPDLNDEYQLGRKSLQNVVEEAIGASFSARSAQNNREEATGAARYTEGLPTSGAVIPAGPEAAATEDTVETCVAGKDSTNIALPYGTDHDSPELPCLVDEEMSAKDLTNNDGDSEIADSDGSTGQSKRDEREKASVETSDRNILSSRDCAAQAEDPVARNRDIASSSSTNTSSNPDITRSGASDMDDLAEQMKERLRSVSAAKASEILSSFIAFHPRSDQILLHLLTGDIMTRLRVLREGNMND